MSRVNNIEIVYIITLTMGFGGNFQTNWLQKGIFPLQKQILHVIYILLNLNKKGRLTNIN